MANGKILCCRRGRRGIAAPTSFYESLSECLSVGENKHENNPSRKKKKKTPKDSVPTYKLVPPPPHFRCFVVREIIETRWRSKCPDGPRRHKESCRWPSWPPPRSEVPSHGNVRASRPRARSGVAGRGVEGKSCHYHLGRTHRPSGEKQARSPTQRYRRKAHWDDAVIDPKCSTPGCSVPRGLLDLSIVRMLSSGSFTQLASFWLRR